MHGNTTPEDIALRISNVTLTQARHVSARDGKEAEERAFLRDQMCGLASAASALSTQIQEAQALNGNDSAVLSCRVAALGSLLQRTTEITEIGHAVEEATVNHIISRLKSLTISDGEVHKLLLHFRLEVKGIIKDTYKASGWNQESMVRILEACYAQTLSGNLHVEGYFASLYEAALGSPYDSEFESEEYYDHESRLQIDDDSAEAECARQKRQFEARIEAERRTDRAWVGFWVRTLHGCSGGPTLFWPYSTIGDSEDLPETPKYLFRTYDAKSSGRSDDSLVASSASIYQAETSRTDLLSLDQDDIADRLCAHFNKNCFGETSNADNLMSWSSSLLVALQYAIWRCSKGRLSSADVQICVVDTTKFPTGQFARDTWLFKQCHDGRSLSPKIRNQMRLREMGYDNGEYLSQGLVVHRDRSTVVTLEDIISSGLTSIRALRGPGRAERHFRSHIRNI